MGKDKLAAKDDKGTLYYLGLSLGVPAILHSINCASTGIVYTVVKSKGLDLSLAEKASLFYDGCVYGHEGTMEFFKGLVELF